MKTLNRIAILFLAAVAGCALYAQYQEAVTNESLRAEVAILTEDRNTAVTALNKCKATRITYITERKRVKK